jgi:hypothetical protein
VGGVERTAVGHDVDLGEEAERAAMVIVTRMNARMFFSPGAQLCPRRKPWRKSTGPSRKFK